MVNKESLYEERKQDLYLGKTRIPEVALVTIPSGQREKRITDLGRLIDEIKSNQLLIEEKQLQIYREEMRKIKYPILDLSFLSTIPHTIVYKGQNVRLPGFGVYHIDEEDFSVSIENPNYEGFLKSLIPMCCGDVFFTGVGGLVGAVIGAEQGHTTAGALSGALLGFSALRALDFVLSSRDYETSILNGRRNLPRKFRDELVKTIEFSDYVVPREKEGDGYLIHEGRKIPSKIKKKFKKFGDTTFSTRAGFTISPETRKQIREAQRYFGRPNLYFIKEIKPEEWNATKFTYENPLVIGLYRDKCYLLDSFNHIDLGNVAEGGEKELDLVRETEVKLEGLERSLIREMELRLMNLEREIPPIYSSTPCPPELARAKEKISYLETEGIGIPEEVLNHLKKIERKYKEVFDNYTEYLMITAAGATGAGAI